MKDRRFRVIVIDDQVYQMLRGCENSTERKAFVLDQNKTSGLGAAALLGGIVGLGEKSPGNLELFLAGDVSFDHPVFGLTTQTTDLPFFENDTSYDEILRWLQSADVLILDIGGLGPLPIEWELTSEDLPGTPIHDIDELNSGLSGAGLFLKKKADLASCQLIAVLTVWDGQSAGIVAEYLDPLCRPGLEPEVRKYDASRPKHINQLIDIITSKYKDFSSGYIFLQNQGAIEFAASHDMPVLILGESGTGKEGIARAIHRRWRQEKRRDTELDPKSFLAINCGSLIPSLARAELFGHVRGSFTDANEHRLGYIMEACGIKRPPSKDRPFNSADRDKLKEQIDDLNKLLSDYNHYQEAGNSDQGIRILRQELVPQVKKMIGHQWTDSAFSSVSRLARELEATWHGADHVDSFKRKLVDQNPHLLENDGDHDIRFKHPGPFGTLFLDEFGDLPSDVQSLLLRYLEALTQEIHPIGFPGRIIGARVRIIAATSDPRIAMSTRTAERLKGSWRSAEEMARPIRQDLLNRITGQIIRAEGITPENVDSAIEKKTGASATPWSSAAKRYVAEGIRRRLDEIDKAMEAVDSGTWNRNLPTFGHWRELDQLVKLVDTHLETWEQRGFRGKPKHVTPDIVERHWKPASVVTPGSATQVREPQGPLDHSNKLVDQAWKNFNQFVAEGVVESDTADFELLKLLFEHANQKPGEILDKELIIGHFSELDVIDRLGGHRCSNDSTLTNTVNRIKSRLKSVPCGWEIPRGRGGYRLHRIARN